MYSVKLPTKKKIPSSSRVTVHAEDKLGGGS